LLAQYERGELYDNKNMSITEVVQKFPKTVEVFLKYGMHCLGCMAARFENVEQGALAHGINVDKLMQDLNNAKN
jgi:hybrid cluster-associated redox disulfide protein